MDITIYRSQEELESEWAQVPWWLLYSSTFPSAFIWLAIMIQVSNPLVSILMIFLLGVPTKLLHKVFKNVCVFKFIPPTITSHVKLFAGQSIIYGFVAFLVLQP